MGQSDAEQNRQDGECRPDRPSLGFQIILHVGMVHKSRYAMSASRHRASLSFKPGRIVYRSTNVSQVPTDISDRPVGGS